MGFWIPLATMTASRVRGIVGVSQEFEPRACAYHASKWALEGLSQSLAAEVAGFGIKVTGRGP